MANAVPVNSNKNAASAALDAALGGSAGAGSGAKPGDVTIRQETVGDGTNQNEYIPTPGSKVKLPNGTVREDR